MNSFITVLPWATPAPIGLVLGTGFSIMAVLLMVILIVVDSIIYLPFIKAYDSELLKQEAENVEIEEKIEVIEETQNKKAVDTSNLVEGKKVLVLCAGAGTSAMLANALEEGAQETGISITASAGAYGSHYEIMSAFDAIVLAPQVASYYEDIKSDTDRLGIKLIRTKGAQYIELTQNPKEAIEFILKEMD